MSEAKEQGYVCIECGANAPSVTFAYFGSDCCGKVVDKYVEYELVTIMLDLLLHRPQAYAHTVFNIMPQRKEINVRKFIITDHTRLNYLD